MPIDYSKYPPNWKTEIVPRILKRADHCCEFCGVENKAQLYSVGLSVKQPGGKCSVRRIWVSLKTDADRLAQNFTIVGIVKRVRVVLTIAHLDHDEENHDVKDDRLAALCQQCHNTYDAREKYRRIVAKSSGV